MSPRTSAATLYESPESATPVSEMSATFEEIFSESSGSPALMRMTTPEFREQREKAIAEAEFVRREAQRVADELEAEEAEVEFRRSFPLRAKSRQILEFARVKAVMISTPFENALAKVETVLKNSETADRAKSSASHVFEVATTTRSGMMLTFAILGFIFGGFLGFVIGLLFGVVMGFLLAIFTFGLSIPAGALIGCGIGATCGSVLGAGSGAALGYTGFAYRKEVHSFAHDAYIRVEFIAGKIWTGVQHSATGLVGPLRSRVGSTGGSA